MVLRKSFYIRWSAGRSPRVHEVNPSRDPSIWNFIINICSAILYNCFFLIFKICDISIYFKLYI